MLLHTLQNILRQANNASGVHSQEETFSFLKPGGQTRHVFRPCPECYVKLVRFSSVFSVPQLDFELMSGNVPFPSVVPSALIV